MPIIKNYSFAAKQRGATLFTTLTLLLLMAVVSIAASKISIIDILISGNDQQRVLVFQETANRLTQFTNTNNLSSPLSRLSQGEVFGNVTNKDMTFKFANSPAGITEIITDLPEQYGCVRQGVGSSLGAGAPVCDLYDFQVERTNTNNTGIKDKHHRGAGKMVPNSKSKASIL